MRERCRHSDWWTLPEEQCDQDAVLVVRYNMVDRNTGVPLHIYDGPACHVHANAMVNTASGSDPYYTHDLVLEALRRA